MADQTPPFLQGQSGSALLDALLEAERMGARMGDRTPNVLRLLIDHLQRIARSRLVELDRLQGRTSTSIALGDVDLAGAADRVQGQGPYL